MDQGKKETAEGEGDEEDWALDCVVVGSSGKTFQASKAVLAAKSKVFKEILSKPPSAGQAPGDPVTLQLDDDDQEIQALLENFHHPDKFLKSIIPELSKEGVQSLKSLTVIATKYGLKGAAHPRERFIAEHHRRAPVAYSPCCIFRSLYVLYSVVVRTIPRSVHCVWPGGQRTGAVLQGCCGKWRHVYRRHKCWRALRAAMGAAI